MKKTLGAMTGLALLGLLLVGPAYLAISNAATAPRCIDDLGCDPRAALSDLR